MASRHDIISISFQANAGKANVALQALQSEAEASAKRVTELKEQLKQLEKVPQTAETSAQISLMTENLAKASKEAKQWKKAAQELGKGVRTIDEAIKQFNAGTLDQMSAAFNKTAANAAKLQKTKLTPGTQEWKEMDALFVEASSNVLKANTNLKGLVDTLKQGGITSKDTLTQAKTDLEQLCNLEVRGSKEWKVYDGWLKVVKGSVDKLVQAEQKAAQADKVDVMNKRMRSLKTLSDEALAETKRFWQQMVAGADNGSAELEKYEANLQKVVNQERNRGGKSAEKILTNMDKSGIDNVRNAVSEMTQLRDSTMQGIPAWQHYNKLVKQGEAYLAQYAEREKIARGETVSLSDAMKLSATAGGKGFQGTAQQLQMAEEAIKKAMLAAEKGSKEWIEYSQALARVQMEAKHAGMTSEDMRKIIAQPTNAKNLNELSAAVKRAKAELHLMGETVGNSSKEYDELAAQTKKAEFQLKKMEGATNGTASSFEKAWSRLKTYIGLYMGAAVAIQKLMATMGNIMEMSDKMGEVRKTTGFTADEVGHLTGNLKKLDTRTTINGLLELSAAAGQLGLKSETDVEGFTEAANKLMVALPEMGKEGATQMLKIALATGEIDKIQRQMADGTVQGSSAVAVAMEKIGSTIDRLRASSASAAPAITDFVQRVGAVGAQNGIAISQIAALGSTVDSIGMRVEMSATALSRMIPAIRDNAFDIAKVIGVTPDTLRNLFDTGRGMEAILMILQHIKDSGMDADSVESMLGMGSMKEIMKELNQQGARAGIVFSGLSQNVDELRRQLGVADEAYEQNIAIQQEYDKMNETTAAKWERLKNQISEVFVNDESQRFFGTVIDGLRLIVDFLTGNVSPALRVLSDVVKAVAVGVAVFKIGLGEALAVKSISGIKSMIASFRLMGMYMTDQIKTTWALILAKNADEKASIRAAAANKGLNASMMANVWLAIAAAVFMLGKACYDALTEIDELTKTLGDLANEYADAEHNVNQLMASFKESTSEAETAKRKHQELKAQTNSLRKEVDALKHSTDKRSASTSKLSEKEKELEEKERALKKAADASNQANNAHLNLIKEINSKYSSYLGYMLSEKTAAEQVASAHQLIIAALREEMRQKGINRKREAIDKKYEEKETEYSHDSMDELSRLPRATQQRIMDQWTRVMANIKSDIGSNDKQTYSLSKIPGIAHSGVTFDSEKQLKNALKITFEEILSKELPIVYREMSASGKSYKFTTVKPNGKNNAHKYVKSGRNVFPLSSYVADFWGSALDDGFGDWVATTIAKEAEMTRELRQDQITQREDHRNTVSAAINDINSNYSSIGRIVAGKQKLTDNQINRLAENVNAIVVDLTRYGGDIHNVSKYVGKDNAVSHENAVNTMLVKLDKNTRNRVLAASRRASAAGANGDNDGGSFIHGNYTTSNPWGNPPEATSTDYATWDVNELVARRNQMDKFKNVLKPGVDVKKVLAEDKALMKAFQGKDADWQSVLNWYNTERKKIQEELKKERFSTNTGHWRDEKTKKGTHRRNRFKESDYALAELNRYYERRKKTLADARATEKISEETFNRETERVEQEHLERRSKLRGSFTGEISEKETVAFREWWAGLEKMNELDNVPWATVMNEWAKATVAEIGHNNLQMDKDLKDMSLIVMKHINKIAKIIEKERPFNGITDNLRDNLTTMDILFADMPIITEQEIQDGSRMVEGNRRTSFLLGETQNAYTLTSDQLMKDMSKAGFAEWSDAINSAPNAELLKRQMLAQLKSTYDALQDATKKESTTIKKQVDIWWADLAPGQTDSNKDMFETALAKLGLEEEQVKRVNQMIGAGYASERVADELAIKQMQIRLQMQQTYYAKMREIGLMRKNQLIEEVKSLREQAKEEAKKGEKKKSESLINEATQKEFDAKQVELSLNLAEKEERKTIAELQKDLKLKAEEEMAKLYKELKEWSNLFGSSLQSIFEASHAGDKQYYNDLAKLKLTGKGGPGAGTYIVTEHEGTSQATAHYEYHDESEALERQRKIENDNALTDAWKKVFDDFNAKLSETITDQLNAMLQKEAIDANTLALYANTDAITGKKTSTINDSSELEPLARVARKRAGLSVDSNPFDNTVQDTTTSDPLTVAQQKIDASNKVKDVVVKNAKEEANAQCQTDNAAVKSNKKAFAAMTAAANMYGIAYQAMSNENLSTAQKVQMMIVQAAGQALISMLTAELAADTGKTASHAPSWISKTLSNLGPIAGPVAVGAFTALIGGLMGLATSKISKSKSTIAQATGASASAGRLATGMLTYATGNVNEFTDPSSLTPGRSYNVDAADGRTYRARYMGNNPRTHITNGPEFHLAGERGREMIIDAGTTRQITMNENEIWHTIQTLSNGGRINHTVGKRMGIPTFADGNVSDFTNVMDGVSSISGMAISPEQAVALQSSIDRQSDLLERALTEGIKGVFNVHGPDGLVANYDRGKKTANRHGERY